jgi:hypothetical protein
MCTPITDAFSYDVWYRAFVLHDFHVKCYNPIPFWLFIAVYNLTTDVIIWTLPMIFFLNIRLSTSHYRPLAVRLHTTRAEHTRSSVVEPGRTECRYHRGLRTLPPTTLSQSARQGEEQRTAKSWSRVAFSWQPGHVQDANHSIT